MEKSSTKLSGRSRRYPFKRVVHEYGLDECSDLAAGLTYRSVLSIFPALVALVSILGVVGQGERTVNTMLQLLTDMGATSAANTMRGPIEQMANSRGAGIGLIIGVLGALWSASGYVAAFGRALDRVYGVVEGRPTWKLRPIQVLITLLLIAMAALMLLGLAVSGTVATTIADRIGIGHAGQLAWSIAKWPVMLLILIAMIGMLYRLTPNVKQPNLRWFSLGSVIAILSAVIGTALFGFYVSNFSKYNKTYGALAGVIVMLLWIYLINSALLFGAEVDAEIERARQLEAGIAAEGVLQLPPKDTRASDKKAMKRRKLVRQGRSIREQAGAEQASSDQPSTDQADTEPTAAEPASTGRSAADQPTEPGMSEPNEPVDRDGAQRSDG